MKKILPFLLWSFLMLPMVAWGTEVDSLLHILKEKETSGDKIEIMELYYKLGNSCSSRTVERYDDAISYYNKAEEIAMEQNNFQYLTLSLIGVAASLQRNNDYQQALGKLFKIIELEKEEIEQIGENGDLYKAKAYTQISAIYQALGDYEKAFENQMQGLLLFEVNQDSMGIANSHYNIGTIFFFQLQYDKALESYQKTKEICDALKNERFIYSCLAALGAVHAKLGNYEKSLSYNQESLALAKKLNYKTGIAYALGNIASNFTTKKKYIKAEEYYLEAIQLKIELGDKNGAIGNKIEIAQLYLEWGKSFAAKQYLEEALVAAQDLNSRSRQSDIYKNLADVYAQLNEPLKAYNFSQKYIGLKDSLLNEKTLEEMGQSQRRFEVQKSAHEIEILKKENELLGKNEEIQKQQIYLFAITTFAFLMFMLWNRNKLKYQNRVNKLLEEKNLLLNSKNEEIHIKNKQLEHSNEDLQQFAYVASHDLKEPLRMINSYTNLLKRRYSASFDEAGNEFMHYIVDAVGRMETLLDDLLEFSRAGNGAEPTEFVSTKDVMVMVESNLRHRLETLNATLVIKNNNLPLVKAHRTQLLQLLQNLVSNGVKFKGEREPIVEVDAVPLESGYVFSVSDNGIGISKENLEKVFEMFRRLHTRDEYEGTGIGLATCKRIVSTWGGDIWVESEEGQGSTFFFSVPHSAIQLSSEKEMEVVPA